MKNNMLNKFLTLLLTLCVIIPQVNNLYVKAEVKNQETSNLNNQILYAAANFSNTSRTVAEFTYNNNKDLIYTVLTVPDGNKNGTISVRGNNSMITSITIPNTVTDNEGNVYSVTTIGSRAFAEYEDLQSVTIPENVTEIRNNAFLDCSRLKTIKILSTDLTVYNSAFKGISKRAVFYVRNEKIKDRLIDYIYDDNEIIIERYDDDDEDWYRVTVKADDGGTASGSGSYEYRETVDIRATPDSDYEFERWEVTYGDVTFEDKYDRRTSFRMPSERVTIIARFNYVGYKNNNNSSSGSNINNNTNINNNNNSTLLPNIQLDNFLPEEKKGEDIVIDLKSNPNVSTETFQQVIGKNTDIVFLGSGYKWRINGKNIATDIENKAYCNLGVTFTEQTPNNMAILTEYKNILQFELDYKGDLPFQGMLEVYPKNIYNGQPLYMYKYNPLNTLEYKDYDISNGNAVIFDIKAAATYIITTEILKDTYVIQSPNITAKYLESVVPYFEENGQEKLVVFSTRNGNDISFVAPKTTVYNYRDNSKNFVDIENHWAVASINFLTSRELFKGISVIEFSPDSPMTRGMFLTALGNLNNIDTSQYNTWNNFAYYTPYVAWASENGILSNIQNNDFSGAITREEMAVIFQNYSRYINIQLPQGNSNTTFADNNQISSWAIEAVSSMQKASIINGKENNNFDPKGMATRAEASVLFRKLIETMLYKVALA